MNPLGLKEEIERLLEELGFGGKVKVAAVYGDDILSQYSQLKEKKGLENFSLEGEEEKVGGSEKFTSMNAYFGARAIVEALKQGASIIVTGRVVDSCLCLAPLVYEYGWDWDNYDLIAKGSVAGHIIECATQCTGGNFTDWEESYSGGTKESGEGWSNMGYPIIECYSDGSFIVTKPRNTGGLVSRGTVLEQMLYEIGDPSTYILPDVIVDFRSVQVTEIPAKNGERWSNRVHVDGARGRPPTNYFKVSSTYMKGTRLSIQLLVGGENAYLKAKAISKSLFIRVSRILKMFSIPDFEPQNINVECIGAEQTYGENSNTRNSREVILRISVTHEDKRALFFFGKEVAPVATSMAPGVTGGGDGRPAPSDIIEQHSFLVKKELIPNLLRVSKDDYSFTISSPKTNPFKAILDTPQYPQTPLPLTNILRSPLLNISYSSNVEGGFTKVPLIKLCWGRSGDKGDSANIGIICRDPLFFSFVEKTLTEENVYQFFKHYVKGKVARYILPSSFSFNFILTKSLGGGGLSSLNIDKQGKTYAQILLNYPVSIPFSLTLSSPQFTHGRL
eukprot:TRINITY_DN2824_c0_g1_i1.p1 TRINITY_DN2824_c0_g1~~TRINITY_DN2824_c0_g1_i1.p1  ORF type:complete len:561 (-),score=155.10 TRINITY_DN2824_c0_g1_i1:64-1746(-)